VGEWNLDFGIRGVFKTAEEKGLPYQSLVNEILAGELRKAG
jgi:predicted DNA binding CopG/RHH family protein